MNSATRSRYRHVLTIGQRRYLPRHTVTTQAISIYRELGVSSRGEVVQRVQEVGLLGA